MCGWVCRSRCYTTLTKFFQYCTVGVCLFKLLVLTSKYLYKHCMLLRYLESVFNLLFNWQGQDSSGVVIIQDSVLKYAQVLNVFPPVGVHSVL